jgi:hypothetical protein
LLLLILLLLLQFSSSAAAAAAGSGCGLELVLQFFLFLLSELCSLILLKTPWIDQSWQITIPNNNRELCSNSSRPD